MGASSKQQRNPSHVVEATNPNLPHEIIVEILKRVAVKSLCRFRCVSKSWLSLLSSPQFAKSQIDLALKSNTLYSKRRRLMFSSYNLYSVDYESIGIDNGDIIAVELDYPLKDKSNEILGPSENDGIYFKVSEDEDENPVMVKVDVQPFVNSRNWVEIWGSCNGLLCIAPDEDSLFLFNPSTRESKKILEESNYVTAFGFGYDSTRDDYKVVRINAGVASSVYSLRTDSWRKIDNFCHDFCFHHSGVFLRGAIHWMAINREEVDDEYYVISAFDMEKELFWDMPAPDMEDDDSEFMLGTLNEDLCVLKSFNEMHNDFWVMHEYGVGESWTRLTISLSYICMKPLCLAKNGEALLDIDGRLVQYNLENNTYKELVVHGIPVGVGFEADTYIETLISPNDYSGRET
ncbi:F-box/kelch-repeat protein At3g06240 [Ricinus communis]|uniref:F-box domain-containing protein n=1 Tax=Ricinus communis TaxID=3988 RepID=B9RST7_RICCO|nr:F-box/kelch-repeat protein At3g06240 [Ricinus communis]EEF45420.1 conserved hypothetical protein [Ricinus communis]|eukprot:XP_002516806.1 F-box/kelch-repeat protein At3g06240 [Ricinus communis]